MSLPTPENFHKSPEISPSLSLFLNSPEKNTFSSFCIIKDNFSVRSALNKRYISLHGLKITVLVSCIVHNKLFLWANVDTCRHEASAKFEGRGYIKKYSSHFQKAWKVDPKFSPWLREVAGETTKAFCGICRSEFSVADAGLYTVRLHANGQGHKAKAEVHTRNGVKPLKQSLRLTVTRSKMAINAAIQ